MKIAFVSVGERPYAKYTASSFAQHIPEAEIIQVTDHVTPEILGVDTVLRKDYDGHLMLFLIKGFMEIKFDDVLITTADDCMLKRPIDDIIEGDFDVAIVYRKPYPKVSNKGELMKFKHKFTYTNGIVVVKNKQFYRDCYEALLKMEDFEHSGRKFWDWWGDMGCIKEVLQTGKYRIKELDEYEFCYKPEFLGDNGNDRVRMIHYAGKRKHWMAYHK